MAEERQRHRKRRGSWWSTPVMLLGIGLIGYSFFFGHSGSSRPAPIAEQGAPPKIIEDVPRDAIPPLDSPSYVPAAAADWLHADDLVLGIAFMQDARAYPLKIMNWHEIVNDTVAGDPILVTYCPLCRSGIVFDRRLNGRELSFGNTGSLYESGMVMYDRETESQWYQPGGRAITGELSGQELTVLPSTLTTWSAWSTAHPKTVVLSLATGYTRDYDRDGYVEYAALDEPPAFPVSVSDDRLPPKALIVGVILNGVAKAYPLMTVPEGELRDTIGSVPVTITKQGSTLEVFTEDGPAPTQTHFWFSWFVAHPDTTIFTPGS